MKKVSILTATRAEYGLLKPIIEKLNLISYLDVRVVVTGSHLLSEYGLTYKEIEQDSILIDEKIEILLGSDTPSSISKSMGLAMIGFADYLEKLSPDMIVLLGDRYETLAVGIVAMNHRIPIAHLYGGETTEGAIDESIRHALTKLSYLHFTSTKEYSRRVIQLGENPERVFCVGSTGVENILNTKLLSKSKLQELIGFNLEKPYAIVTFHPVTLEDESAKEQILSILEVCKIKTSMNFIITKSNADSGGRIINEIIDDFAKDKQNIIVFNSMGQIKYLSAMKYCSVVIGNSSSGLTEAPSFSVPTINIGDRQKGRIQADSIINCIPNTSEIIDAISLVLSDSFKEICNQSNNPYEGVNTSTKIVEYILRFLIKEKINLKKIFYDIK